MGHSESARGHFGFGKNQNIAHWKGNDWLSLAIEYPLKLNMKEFLCIGHKNFI